mgnify:CR=1 FL=1
MRSVAWGITAAVGVLLAAGVEVQAQEGTGSKPPDSVREERGLFGTPLHGSISARFRSRWNSDESDKDLYEYLTLDYGEVAKDRVTAHLFLRAEEDLDGDRGVNGYFSFDSIHDTYDSNLQARLYYAHLDFNGEGLVFLKDGVPLQGITNSSVFKEGFGRDIVRLFEPCKGG